MFKPKKVINVNILKTFFRAFYRGIFVKQFPEIWRPHALSLQISDENLVDGNKSAEGLLLLNYWGSLMKSEGLHEMAEPKRCLTVLNRC